MKEKIGILIADDHLLVRQGIKNLLSKQNGLKIVGEAVDGIDAVEKTLKMNPDIVLLDINMPNMNGFQALEMIKKNKPSQKVIMLTIHDSLNYIKESLRFGADGYVSKDADIDILKDAINRVNNGEIYLQPTIFKQKDVEEVVINLPKINNQSSDEVNEIIPINLKNLLTPREFEIIEKIGEGQKNKEIGALLNISEKTVRNHMYNIFKKLDINDRTQAAILVTQYNLYYK